MRDRILCLSSNGTGLGHLTRSMAIARRLDRSLEPLFFTLSGAAPVVADQGFSVEFAASYATPTAGSDWRWSRRLRGRLRAAMRDADPRVLVFDGAHPYQALLDAMPSVPAAHRVWCRRPMWKPGSNFGALERTRFFDQVLEPGEFAASEDKEFLTFVYNIAVNAKTFAQSWDQALSPTAAEVLYAPADLG